MRRAQGASNGVYLAVDYALAVECLPNPDDKAKDLVRVCPHLPGLAAALGAEAWLDLRRRCGGSPRFSAPASGPHSQARC